MSQVVGDTRATIWVWLAAATVAGVFFLATHDPLAALQWRETLAEEVRELVREVSEGRMRRQLAFPLLAAAGSLALLLRSPLHARWEALVGVPLLAFTGWQLLSIGWSSDPLLSGKRLLVLAMMLIGAAGLVRQLTLDGLVRVVAICTALHLALGVGTELWLGTFAPLQTGYRFAGTLHPNQQGINCALLALSTVYLGRVGRTRAGRLTASAVLTLAMGLLLLTRSRTSLAAVGIALLLFLALDAPPLRRVAMTAGVTAGLALLLLLQANGLFSSAGRLLLLGREDSSLATFTGRTEIWSYGLRHASDRPILGHGYNSFWSPRHTAEISRAVDWKISEGHSAYLDTLLNLGAVGLLLFVSLMTAGIGVALLRHRQRRDPAMAIAAAILVFGMLDGLLESAVVIPNLLSFVTLSLLAAIAWRGGAERPATQHALAPVRQRQIAAR